MIGLKSDCMNVSMQIYMSRARAMYYFMPNMSHGDVTHLFGVVELHECAGYVITLQCKTKTTGKAIACRFWPLSLKVKKIVFREHS